MADYQVDYRDIKFVLFEQLGVEKLLSAEKYSSFARSDLDMVLDEALKLSKEAMGPANTPGDREGCRLENGQVHVPEVYKGLYKTFVEGGWLGIAANPQYGGQGMPSCIGAAATEMFMGGCLSFNLIAMLTTGAANLVESFGTQEQKDTYMPKMYSGEWSGTMCLTEAGAGSDVGLSKCRARKEGDHFLLEGEKIFITAGDQDLTPNIIHMVLARTEGAPKGVKGLTLFLVPKYRVNADGSLGEFNDVHCTGIEHKLGIHGSPTCTLAFGQDGKCWGWVLGKEGEGIKCMFQMMNEARVAVGLQGSALANAAYLGALQYARERVQGSDVTKFKDPTAPAVTIINHPDVRMMLLTQKAYSEGLRALLYSTSYFEDMAHAATSDADKNKYTGLVEILTPVCKAYASDMAFRVTELAVQTYGGYGYISEYPAEQYLRDCKIASLYEGTNGIQALDLVGAS